MILQISRKITRSLVYNSIISFDDISIYQYGIEIMLVTLFETLGILIFAAATGTLMEALVFILAFSPIRVFAGGYHAKTVGRCFTFFLLLFVLAVALAHTANIAAATWISVAAAGTASLIIFRYAPVESPNRPVSESEKTEFRRKALGLTLTYLSAVCILTYSGILTWYVGIFALGMLFEALTLIFERMRRL